MKAITAICPKLGPKPVPIVQVSSFEKCFASRQEQVSKLPELHMNKDLICTNHQMRSIKIESMIFFINNYVFLLKFKKMLLILLLFHFFIIYSILVKHLFVFLLLGLLLLQHLQHHFKIVSRYFYAFIIIVYQLLIKSFN